MKHLYLLLGLVLLLSIGCSEKERPGNLGKAIDFTLMDTDSTFRKLQEFKANVIMLHFWADWCPHCREEFPELQKAYDQFKDNGLLIVGINSGQSFDHVIGIQQEFNLTFPMLVDESGDVAKKYNVTGLPSSYFLDRDGNVIAREVGWLNLEKIEDLIGQLSPSG